MRGYQHAQEHSQPDNQRSKQRKHAHNRRLSVGFSHHEYRQAALVFFGVLLVLLALSKVGVTLVGHNVLPSSKLSRNRGIRDMEDGFGVGGARIGLENRAEQPPLVLNTQQEQDAKFVFERGAATTQPVLSRWAWRKEPEPASLVLYIAILSQPGEAGIRDAARRTWIKSVLDVNQPQRQQVAARFFVSDFGLDDAIRGALQAEAETNGDLQVVQTLSRSSETLETLVAAWEACMQTFGKVQFLIRTQASTMLFPFSLLSQLKTLKCPEGLSCSIQQLYVGAHSPANLTTAADPLYRSTLALDKYIAYMAPDTYAVSGQLILAMLELHRRSGLIFLDHEGPSVGLWISVFASTRVNTTSAMLATPAADTAQQAACSLLTGIPVPGHAAMPPLEACEAPEVDEYRSALQQACQLVRGRRLWVWSGLGLPVDMETLHEDLLQCDARLFTLP